MPAPPETQAQTTPAPQEGNGCCGCFGTIAFIVILIAVAYWAGLQWLPETTGQIREYASNIVYQAAARAGVYEPTQTTGTPTASSKPTPTATPTTRPKKTTLPKSTTLPKPLAQFQNGRWLEQRNYDAYQTLAATPWIADGLDPAESETAENLLYIASSSKAPPWLPELYAMHSVQQYDPEITPSIAYNLRRIAYHDSNSVERLLSHPLLQAPDNRDAEILRQLARIAYSTPEYVPELLEMPFLQEPGAGATSALQSMGNIAYRDAGALSRIMRHPTVARGITENWTPVIAALESAARRNPELIDQLLDPDDGSLNSRTVSLPLSGTVKISILRIGDAQGNYGDMELLEQAIRHAEHYMQLPLPTTAVTVLFAETTVPGFAGTNYGSHIAIRPEQDVYRSDQDVNRIAATMAHEVAHYYWAGNPDWVDEGMANVMEAHAENLRAGKPVQAQEYPCPEYSTLENLDSATPGKQNSAFGCNYSLGERLFLQLAEQAGENRFRQAVRDMYLDNTHRTNNPAEPRMTYRDAARAFAGIGMEQEFLSIYRHGASRPMPAQVNPTWNLPELHSEIHGVWIAQDACRNKLVTTSAVEAAIPAANASIGALFLCLEYKHQAGLSPVRMRLTLEEYHEDGFAYDNREIELEYDPQYIGKTAGRSVGPGSGNTWRPGTHLFILRDLQGKTRAAYRLLVMP